MSERVLRITSSNTHYGEAFRSRQATAVLMPDDGVPSVVGFQEALPSRRSSVVSAIEKRGYQAVVPSSGLDLAFAASPEITVKEAHELLFLSDAMQRVTRLRRTWKQRHVGLHVVHLALPDDEEAILANLHLPIYISLTRGRALEWARQRMAELSVQNPDALLALTSDHNSMYPTQVAPFHAAQRQWGGESFLRRGAATYPFRGPMGMDTLQPDSIHLRPPRGTRLARVTPDQADEDQLAVTVTLLDVPDTDHRAVENTLHWRAAHAS